MSKKIVVVSYSLTEDECKKVKRIAKAKDRYRGSASAVISDLISKVKDIEKKGGKNDQ